MRFSSPLRDASSALTLPLLLGALALSGCGGDDRSEGAPAGTGGLGNGGADTGATGSGATQSGSGGTESGGTGGGATESGGAGTGATESGGTGTGATGTGGSSGGTACIGTPTGSCADRLCDVMPGCTPSEPAACDGDADVCSTYDGQGDDCDAQWGCGFGANGACARYDTACDDFSYEEYCTEIPGCSWNGLFCMGDVVQSCATATSLATCEANPVCYWTAATVEYCGGVPTPCASMTSETCELQAGCTLAPATCDGTPTACEELSGDDCLLQPGCRLASGGTRVIEPTGITVNNPDLAFDEFSVQRAVSDPEDVLEVSLVELNRGSRNAAPHTVKIILSVNETYGDADDYELYAGEVSFQLYAFGLGDYAVVEGYSEMPDASLLEPGYYYPIGVLDSEEVVAELEEGNNVVALPAVYVGPNVFDLAAVSLAQSVTGVFAPGDALGLSLTVRNDSTRDIASAAVTTYLSADAVLDASDVALDCPGTLDLNLAVAEEAAFPLSCTLPRARGTYHLLAEVDPEDALGDADRANNVVATDTTITIEAPSPDLVVSELASDSYAVDWKGTVTLSATVTNTGADPAPATSVSFFVGGTDALCSASVAALDGGAAAPVTAECTLRSGDVGALPLRAQVDAADAIYETDEANNVLDGATDIVVPEPDINLIAAGVGILAGGETRSSADPNPVTVYFTIENDGTADAPPFRFIMYASVDTSIDPDDDIEFCIRDATTGQAAGTTTEGASTPCEVPTMPTGEYYIGLIVDTEGDIPETSETDNVAFDTQNKLTIE